ncbi:MAG: hypothetical protein M3252_05790 [Actinomycetota bacterium]|nr:hypothetical protein [Actinomycetota bacterium]
MESWQVVVAVFFVLLPLVLMLDFWGDERLTTRGWPIRREWNPQAHGHRSVSHELVRGRDDPDTRIGQN